MIPIRIKAGRGELLAIKTDKFKIEMLTLTLPIPMEQRTRRLCSLLFSIMRRGCVPYPNISSLSRRLDDLYDANISTMTAPVGESICAGFACECLEKKYVVGNEDLLDGTLDTLKKMLYEPLTDENGLFREKALELEKRCLCDSIRMSDNDPKIHSFQLCRGAMFDGEPYGKRASGTIDDVMAVSPRELTEFHREYLSLASPLFVYVGSRTADEVRTLIEKHFPDFGGSERTAVKTILRPARPTMTMIEEDMSVLQGKLTIGFRAELGAQHKDIYSAVLMNDIFGGSPSSKLFQNVREKQSLCYSCSSSFDMHKGALFVRSGISNENKDIVIEEVLRQFEAIKEGQISEYELICAKRAVQNSYRQVSDSVYALESYYRTRFLAGISTTPDEATKIMEKVSSEDIMNTAKLFGADTCAFVRGTLERGEYCEEGFDDEQ